MNKKILSYLLIALFTAFIAAPTLTMFSKNIDSSIFYNLNEEDTTSNKNLKVFKFYGIENNSDHLVILDLGTKNSPTGYLILYMPYAPECTSPPPEFVA